MKYDIWFEFASLLFLLMVFIHYIVSKKFPNKKNRLFGIYMIAAIVDLSFNIISSILISYPQSVPLWLNIACSQIFYISQYFITCALLNYIFLLSGMLDGRYKRLIIYTRILFSIVMLSIVLNPLTKLFFYFDENLVYQSGAGFSFLLGLALFNLVYAWVISLINRRKSDSINPISLGIFFVFVLLLLTIQSIYKSILLSGLAISIGSLLIYMKLQNPQDQKDPLTKTYSRPAFSVFINEAIMNHRSYPIVYADIRHTSAFNKTFGENNGNQLIRTVAQSLMKINSRNLIFRYTGDSFMMVIRGHQNSSALIEAISRMMKQSIELGGVQYEVNINSFFFTQMKQASSVSELLGLLDHSIYKCKLLSEPHPLNITNEIIREARRRVLVEEALTRALEEKTINVLLQPIYDVQLKQFLHAEALCRIDDKKLGTLMPNEFIPIAEKSGQIGILCSQVLQKACEYLGKIPAGQKPPFETISVNLSVSDCLNPNLASDIKKILSLYGTDPGRLVLEITEHMTSVSSTLRANMEELAKIGISFACDDFGMGYGNLDQVASLPFKKAKLGKTMVQMISDEKERTIITQLIGLLHELGLKTVAEGIETEKAAQMVINAGADYIQGFYYSKPIPLEEMMNFLLDNC